MLQNISEVLEESTPREIDAARLEKDICLKVEALKAVIHIIFIHKEKNKLKNSKFISTIGYPSGTGSRKSGFNPGRNWDLDFGFGPSPIGTSSG
ncbi:hypothetical protein V6N12_074690 [Hibiscus sabdariffa]|uniref:Uncharacterized protein n=1 Tax=Hibiscus sabdariffa TaxID=183260 RepID=A0ABR2BZG6_9ROSI